MIGRDLKSIYIPPKAGPRRRRRSRSRDLVTERLPRHAASRSRCAAARSSASPAWSAPAERRWPQTVFGIEPPLGGSDPLDGRPCPIASPRDAIAQGHLSRPGGPQAVRAPARPVDRREHLARRSRRHYARMLIIDATARAHGRRGAAHARSAIKAPRVETHRRHAVRRQPAEGGAGEVAVDAARTCHHLRRADARHRRRRQERDLRRSCASSPTPASRS